MKDFQTKKAIAYVRISSTKQVDNESPETQKEVIKKYAESNNIEILEWFYDEAKSGKNADREQLIKLLEYAEKYKGQIDHVLVYKMNRMSRDIDTYVTQVKVILKAKGITIRSATEPIDDSITGRLMENLLVLLGQVDNEVKAGAVKDNMKALAMQGYYQNSPMVGYISHKIENDLGKPRPTLRKSPMADKVKLVLERFSKGDISKAELARYAKEVGLKSRYDRYLNEESINRLLKNPIYAGFINNSFTDNQSVPGKHPAIISLSTYEKNQALLSRKNAHQGQIYEKLNATYPLKGLLLCASCTLPLHSSAPKTGNGGKSPRYHCARVSCRGKVPSVKTDIVHKEFENILKDLRPSDELLKLYKHVLIKEANSALDNLNTKIAVGRQKLNKLSELRSRAINRFVADELTKEEKDEYIANLDSQKLSLSIELDKFEQQQTIRESDIDQAINVMSNVDKQWATSELDLQVRFQNMLFPRGVVYDSKEHTFGTSDISELYRYVVNEKGAEAPSKSYLVHPAGFEPTTFSTAN